MNLLSRIFLFIALVATSCSQNQNNTLKLSLAVQEKASQMENEINNYYVKNPDSGKHKLALFLLENSKYHSHSEGPRIQQYSMDLDTSRQYSWVQYDHFKQLENSSSLQDSSITDILALTADSLTTIVSDVYDFYSKLNWSKQMPMNVLREFLLPTNINNESFSNSTKYYRDKFFASHDSSYFNLSFQQAVSMVHEWDYLNTLGFRLIYGSSALGIPKLSSITLDKLMVGSCEQLTTRSCAKFRALGIPATIDFTPTYLNLEVGHSWAVAILDSNTFIPLDASTQEPGIFKQDFTRIAKVYRRNFSVQKNSHLLKRGECSYLPGFFNDPFCSDVTKIYTKTSDVTIPIKNKNIKNGESTYLSLFTARKDWKPIAWGEVNKGSAFYKEIGRGGVYLPVFFEKGNSVSLNDPFILDSLGNVGFLRVDTVARQSLVLERKFPLNDRKIMFIQRMVGGVFQGANKPDFSDATDLAIIAQNPGEHINSIEVSCAEKFQYLRYFAPIQSFGNVAEIIFYSSASPDSIIIGKVIGTDGSWEDNPLTTKEAAFDGNPLTYVDANKGDGVWVGLQLDRKCSVNKIRFLARNDMNSTQEGNEYELFYWNDKWVSMGRKYAKSIELVYDQVPSKTLFWLKNHTSGQEERIFTYQNGQQIWW